MFRQRTKQTIKENFVCLFGRSSGTVFTSGISRAFFEYLNSNVYQKVFTGSEGTSNNLLKNKR